MSFPESLIPKVKQAALALAIASDEANRRGSFFTVNKIASVHLVNHDLTQRMLEVLTHRGFAEKRVNPGFILDGYDASTVYRIKRKYLHFTPEALADWVEIRLEEAVGDE